MPRKAKGPEDYQRQELYRLAEKAGIKYRSRMSKEQLFKALGLGRKAERSKKVRRAAKAAAKAVAKPAAPSARRPRRAKPAGVPRDKPSPAAPAAAAVPAVSFSRYETLMPAGPAIAGYVERGPEIPAGYGHDRVVALPRDPRCVFAYWELGGGGYEKLRKERGEADLAGAVWVLRVERVPEGRFYDLPVDPGARNWYLSVEPAARYRLRIGLVLASGAFAELAVSDEVLTPSEVLSDRVDEEWMLVKEEFDKLLRHIARERLAGGPGSPRVRAEELRGRRAARALFAARGVTSSGSRPAAAK